MTVAAPDSLEMTALSADSKQPGNSGSKQQESSKPDQSGTDVSDGSADKASNIVLSTDCLSLSLEADLASGQPKGDVCQGTTCKHVTMTQMGTGCLEAHQMCRKRKIRGKTIA